MSDVPLELEPHSVMYFVEDPEAAKTWYRDFLALPLVELAPDYFGFRQGRCWICFHQADAKVTSGPAGSVVYWPVFDFDAFLERARSLGAKVHRGPLDIEDGQAMAQLQDPFGNLFGVLGPRASAKNV